MLLQSFCISFFWFVSCTRVRTSRFCVLQFSTLIIFSKVVSFIIFSSRLSDFFIFYELDAVLIEFSLIQMLKKKTLTLLNSLKAWVSFLCFVLLPSVVGSLLLRSIVFLSSLSCLEVKIQFTVYLLKQALGSLKSFLILCILCNVAISPVL